MKGAVMLERLEDAERQLVEAREELVEAREERDDLLVQVRFWKAACEQACDEMNRLEDELELLKDTLRALVRKDDPDAT